MRKINFFGDNTVNFLMSIILPMVRFESEQGWSYDEQLEERVFLGPWLSHTQTQWRHLTILRRVGTSSQSVNIKQSYYCLM